MIVDEYPPQHKQRQRASVNVDYNYAAPGCAWVVGIPSLVVLVALVATSDQMSHTFLAGVWPYLTGFFLLVLTPCAGVIGWHFYKAKKRHDYERRRQIDEENRRKEEQRLLKQQASLAQQTNCLLQEARLQNDNVKISYGDNGALKSIEVVRAAVLVQQAQIQAEMQAAGRRQIAEQRQAAQIAQHAGGVNGSSGEPQEEPVLPVAPAFRQMAHLITTACMPLCFVVDRNDKTRVIPMFGTIDDLLSMAVTGKPGRGKTVALMYYVALLLKHGAEVYVFDPHGAMAELAVLNDRVLPGMPATARIHYFDRKETITGAVPGLYRELEERDRYYRPQMVNGEIVTRRVKHPLLVLADELPILADFDEQVALEYKRVNRQRLKDGDEELEVPSLIYLIRRIVLEARKWRCFFIGSGQSMDAEVLPTKVTENLNSRIVFFSSNRRARMSGLENDAIKNLLPLIRRGGSGVMVYDCARWDEPVIGAIPYITIDDLLEFLGFDPAAVLVESSDSIGANLGLPGAGSASSLTAYSERPATEKIPVSERAPIVRTTGELEGRVNPLLARAGSIPDVSPLGPDDMQFTEEQVREFVKLFKALRNRKECLRRMRNPRAQSGYGLSNRYDKHAKMIVEQYRLER
jgi:hypothetical protein